MALAGCSGQESESEPGSTNPDSDSENATDTTNETDGEDGEDERDDVTEINGISVYRNEYDLAELPYEKWPQYGADRQLPPYCEYPRTAALEEIPDLRTNTVTLYDVENDEGHHPLRTSRTVMRLVYCHHETDDDRYLDKAISVAEALRDIANERGEALYMPYGYDWGSPGGSRFMEAPWSGGMAQGTTLTAYTHLYEATDDTRYRDIADRVFASFTNVKQVADDTWTTVIDRPDEESTDDDEPSYFWIEEYPTEPPNHVLNGYMVGLYGLYDYWLLVGGEESERVLEAAITTIQDHLEEYRVPGDASQYDLAEIYRGNERYHSTHINQIEILRDLSNEDYFGEMAETYREDHPYEEYRPDRPDRA